MYFISLKNCSIINIVLISIANDIILNNFLFCQLSLISYSFLTYTVINVCTLYEYCMILLIFLFFRQFISKTKSNSYVIARSFSHTTSAESAVHSWWRCRRRCAWIASALFRDGGARQGWRRDGVEGNGEVTFDFSTLLILYRRNTYI